MTESSPAGRAREKLLDQSRERSVPLTERERFRAVCELERIISVMKESFRHYHHESDEWSSGFYVDGFGSHETSMRNWSETAICTSGCAAMVCSMDGVRSSGGYECWHCDGVRFLVRFRDVLAGRAEDAS